MNYDEIAKNHTSKSKLFRNINKSNSDLLHYFCTQNFYDLLPHQYNITNLLVVSYKPKIKNLYKFLDKNFVKLNILLFYYQQTMQAYIVFLIILL